VPEAQQFTEQFSKNKLMGQSRFGQDRFPDYKTSKTRVCVTVGMMTTGYDCPDLLNVVLLRPIYSPSDFIQMKGRGTRKHTFRYTETEEEREKEKFLLLDFFANCEYFEKEFDYDAKLQLQAPSSKEGEADPRLEDHRPTKEILEAGVGDKLTQEIEIKIGAEGMKIDRELYPEPSDQFEQVVQNHPAMAEARESGNVDQIEDILKHEIFHRPTEYWDAGKIRQSYEKKYQTKRKIPLREMILKALGVLPEFKNRGDRVSEEYQKFVDIYRLELQDVERQNLLQRYFETYLSDPEFRQIMDSKNFARLSSHPTFELDDLTQIKDYLSLVNGYIQEYLTHELVEFAW
jgi:type I restriction enzyme R subunit